MLVPDAVLGGRSSWPGSCMGRQHRRKIMQYKKCGTPHRFKVVMVIHEPADAAAAAAAAATAAAAAAHPAAFSLLYRCTSELLFLPH